MLDFEDMHGAKHGAELGGFWVTDDEVAALWARLTTNAANLNVDMAQNATTRERLLPQYERWRSTMMSSYVQYSEGGWWSKNFSSTLATAESFHNELVEWQRRYVALARRPTTGPALDPVLVGGEGAAPTLEAAVTPLMWVAGIIAMVIAFKVYKDLR